MQVIEVANPLHGAAYRVLYERFQPAFCATRQRQAEILTGFEEVRRWAGSQSPEIAEAYEWAIKNLTAAVERQIAANDMGNQVNVLFAAIPKPPTT